MSEIEKYYAPGHNEMIGKMYKNGQKTLDFYNYNIRDVEKSSRKYRDPPQFHYGGSYGRIARCQCRNHQSISPMRRRKSETSAKSKNPYYKVYTSPRAFAYATQAATLRLGLPV